MNNSKIIVMVSGKINSGKNTFVDFLGKELGDDCYNDYFARALKYLCRDSFKPLTDYLNDRFDRLGRSELNDLFSNPNSWFEKKNPITRHILQIVGTEIVRSIDNDYWIKTLIKNIRSRREPIITISDWRFPNEYEALRHENDFHVIPVRIAGHGVDMTNPINQHISETALDNHPFELRIDNTGTLEELKEQAAQTAYILHDMKMD